MEDLDRDEYKRFIKDMKNMRYESWVKKYPNNLCEIFSQIIDNIFLSVEDVEYFQSNGFDIDEFSSFYHSESETENNPLTYACESSDLRLIKILTKCGANVNMKNENYTPLLNLLLGSEDGADEYVVKKGIKILINNGVKRVLPDFATEIFDDAEISDFINSCEIIDDDEWNDYTL